MAEASTDDIERRAAAEQPHHRGVALADETPDELPALLAIAVGVAILAITIVWPAIRDQGTASPTAASEAAAPAEEEADEAAPPANGEDEDSGEETEVGADLDLALFESELAGLGIPGISLTAAGAVVTAEGVVPDEATRTQVLDYLSGQPGVVSVVDGLTIEAPSEAVAGVTATAAQVSIVLEGTVPDEATEQALVERAIEVYSEAQVDNQLVVDAGAQPPVVVTVAGSMTDPVLFEQITTAFEGIDGVEVGEATITLEESNEVESSLNALEPIQFASGSALVEPASEAILDEAAELLIANPDVALEIGGHTDSVGGEDSNQTLSQARAETVLVALQARGVTNELTAVGFGERRLKVDPDDNDAEAQRTNRRIEFRITN